MQFIDNAFIVHNLDDRASQIYEFKIVDYVSPLINPNLEVDPSFAMRGAYFSDLFFPEDKELGHEAEFKGLRGVSDKATSIFDAPPLIKPGTVPRSQEIEEEKKEDGQQEEKKTE